MASALAGSGAAAPGAATAAHSAAAAVVCRPARQPVRSASCRTHASHQQQARRRPRLQQACRAAVRLSKSSAFGAQLAVAATNGRRWSMGRWLDNRAEIEVPVPVEVCWVLWDDRARIPQWMPWIRSVTVQPDNPAMSRWTLATHQFGRDWEFSWLARNLAPVRHQKLHWVSEPGSASLGLNVNNRGQIRFVRRPGGCSVSLSISYEVPDVLAPFANALTPVVEGIISKDMERFRDYAVAYAKAAASAQQQTTTAASSSAPKA